MRLTDIQKGAIIAGSPTRWLGTREVSVSGNTMVALVDRGLAEVKQELRTADGRPYGRFLYRLTEAGDDLRLDYMHHGMGPDT